MKVLLSSLAPVAFASLSVTQPQLFDAAHMKETFKGVAAQGGKIDDDTKANIQAIIDLINGNLTAALGVDYNMIITEYNAAEAELRACNTELGSQTDSYVANAEADYSADLQVHRNCRNFQHATCFWEETNCSIVDDGVIAIFEEEYPTWGGQVVDDDCLGEDYGAVNGWMNDALHFTFIMGAGCPEGSTPAECFNSETVHPTLGLKGCSVENRHHYCAAGSNGTFCDCCDYASCRSNCLTARNLHDAENELCNVEQEDLESAWCSSRTAGCSTCSNFLDCFDAKTTELASTRSHAETAIDLIITQQTALECLLCYGDQIINAGTPDFELCEMTPCEGCGGYVYPTTEISPTYYNYQECSSAIFENYELTLDDNMQGGGDYHGPEDDFGEDYVPSHPSDVLIQNKKSTKSKKAHAHSSNSFLRKVRRDYNPTEHVLCPGLDDGEYCDGGGDCYNKPEWCDCPDAVALCEGASDDYHSFDDEFFSPDCVRSYSPRLPDCTSCSDIASSSRVLSVGDVIYGSD